MKGEEIVISAVTIEYGMYGKEKKKYGLEIREVRGGRRTRATVKVGYKEEV